MQTDSAVKPNPQTSTPTDPATIPDLLTIFGSDPRAIRALFTKHNYRPPTAGTIRLWRHREDIPPRWLLPLLDIAVREKLLVAPSRTLQALAKAKNQ